MRTVRTTAAAAIALASTALALRARRKPNVTHLLDLGLLASLRGRGPRRARSAVAAVAFPSVVLAQAAVLALIVGRKRPRAAPGIIAAPATAIALAWALKHLFDRGRPPTYRFKKKGLESFPSSHTAGVAALAWTIANRWPRGRAGRVAAGLAAAAEIAVVALTRVENGAHLPTDTLAGASIGIAAADAFT